MNSMKIITLLLTFLNILMVNLNGNYQTKEETFLNNIKDAYEKYTITDCSTVVGTMYVVVGKVSGETSLSIFFNNEVSKAYTVRIKRNDKSFVISNYDDYQIYYDIKTKDTYVCCWINYQKWKYPVLCLSSWFIKKRRYKW